MEHNSLIAKEAYPYMAICLILAVIAYFIYPALAIVPFILFLFIVFFFRNPHRNIIAQANQALSPADGRIMSIGKVAEERFLDGQEMIKVSIFLSIFNVHFNRCPLAGQVEKIQYVEGKFFPAFKSHASEDNERNYLLLDTDFGKVLLAQITGFVARRIVCYAQEGETYQQGQRFGLIKFGSCTEIYLPADFQILVKEGDKVKGGLTIIGTKEV